jgi:hypothetical protein
VTPANEQNRAQVGQLAQAVQEETGQSVQVAFVDAGYTGELAAKEAEAAGMCLEVIKLPEGKHGFVLLPHAAGSSSARLPGWRAFVVWHAVMNACQRPWRGFISWLLLCSCCIGLSC